MSPNALLSGWTVVMIRPFRIVVVQIIFSNWLFIELVTSDKYPTVVLVTAVVAAPKSVRTYAKPSTLVMSDKEMRIIPPVVNCTRSPAPIYVPDVLSI